MEARQSFHCLDFYDDLTPDQHVEAIGDIKLQLLEDDRQPQLPVNRDPTPAEFMRKALFIDGFQKTGAQRPMHLDPRIDYLSRKALRLRGNDFVGLRAFVRFVFQSSVGYRRILWD
jgi:hypothetical protein